MRKVMLAMAVGGTLALGACGDDSGPGADLDQQEQAALIQALGTEGMLAPFAAIPFGPMLGEAEIGSMGDFSALASQVKITLVSGEGSETFVYTGITGWQGLDAGANTVQQAISIFHTAADGTFPATIDADIPGDGASAFYFDRTTDSHYFPGDGGVFRLTGSSFGATTDCSDVPGSVGAVILSDCRVATGTMTGNFDFTADRVDGTGPETHTQANTSYDLPAVQLSITLDYSAAELARAPR
jgi:hypothetical protein